MSAGAFRRGFFGFEKSGLWYKLCYLLACAAIICSIVLGGTEHPLRSDVMLVVALSLLIAGFCFFMREHRENASKLFQIELCYLPFALLWLLSIGSPYASKDAILIIVLGLVALVVPATVVLVSLLRLATWQGFTKTVKRHAGILIVIVVYIALSLEVLPQVALFDSYEYFSEVMNALTWSFNFHAIDIFKFCTHQSYGVAPWYMIGGYLTPMDPAGLRIINIMLSCSAIVCFYAIVLKFAVFKDRAFSLSALSTALFAFNPLILGAVFEINLDILKVVFYTWLIASYLYRKDILFAFSALSITFSTESGLVLLFGFGVGWLVGWLIEAHRKSLNFVVVIHQNMNTLISMIGSGIAFVVLFLSSPRWGAGSAEADVTMQAGLNVFYFNVDNIVAIFKEMYLLNFSWLLLAVIGIAVIVWLLRTSKFSEFRTLSRARHTGSGRRVPLSITDIAPIVGSYIALTGFLLLFVMYHNSRYVSWHVVGLTLLAIYALAYIANRKKTVFVGCSCVLAVLMLVQSFFTIDPVTLKSFKNFSTGQSTVVTTRIFYLSKEGLTKDPYLVSARELAGPYNRQYSYVGTTLESLLEDIDYDSNTMVLIDPVYEKWATYVLLFGKRSADADEYYYDPASNRILQMAGPEAFNMKVVDEDAQIDLQEYSEYSRVFFVSMPYRAEFEACQPISGLPILDSGTSEYRLWEMDYYRLK